MKNINQYLPEGFSGAVSVRKKGKNVFQQSFGWADIANRRPNYMDTKFPTASAGKAFVAVGILSLIEKGVLSFDHTIGELLQMDFRQIDSTITIRHLLSHMSGIPDYFDESVMEDYDELWRDYPNYKIRSSKDLLPLFIDKPMMYPKGEKFQYNNSGYVVLGLLIESVTGKPFDDFLQENVFLPCGMQDTGYYELDRLPQNCANAYIWDESRKEYYTNIYSVDAKGTGAGGAFTTVPDIERFWDGILGEKLLSDKMISLMFSPQGGDCYGFGFWLDKTKEGSYSPHFEGCDPGVSFWSSYDREKEWNVTIVSNFGQNVWQIYRNITGLEE